MDTSQIPAAIQGQWQNPTIPIILRRKAKESKLVVRLPYRDDNRPWLVGLASGRRRPAVKWSPTEKAWHTPRNWLNCLVDGALERYGKLYLVQPFREFEKCAPACRNANGHECQCSCMGANHGQGDGGGWFDVSEVFSFRWGDEQAAIRLMNKKS